MNRTCLVSLASAFSSATWGSRASKVRRSAAGCSPISTRIWLGTTPSPESGLVHIASLTVAPRERWRVGSN